MNESDFENELRKLQPAVPSRRLAEGIARDLAAFTPMAEPSFGVRTVAIAGTAEPRLPWLTRWLDRLLWSGLGATAVLALMVSQSSPKPRPTPTAHATAQTAPLDANALQPVLASEEDLGWHDDGVHFDPRGQPMRRLTRTAVERQAWADLKNAGVVQMETPRQEVMWVPVELH
jgi:hypothetical protein